MFAWQELEIRDAVQLITERDASEYPFGYYCTDVEAAAFCWFETIEELLEFLKTRHADIYIDPDDTENVEMKLELDSILTEMGNRLNTAFLDLVNSELDTYSEIHWWGNFEDLVGQNSDFCNDLRETFRISMGGAVGQDEPVAEQEMEAFLEFISHPGEWH